MLTILPWLVEHSPHSGLPGRFKGIEMIFYPYTPKVFPNTSARGLAQWTLATLQREMSWKLMSHAAALLMVRVRRRATARHLSYTRLCYKTSADPEATHSSWPQPAATFAKDLASEHSCCGQLSRMCPLVKAGGGVRRGQLGLSPGHSIPLGKLLSASASDCISSWKCKHNYDLSKGMVEVNIVSVSLYLKACTNKARENAEEVMKVVLASLCRKACLASFLECSRLDMMFPLPSRCEGQGQQGGRRTSQVSRAFTVWKAEEAL